MTKACCWGTLESAMGETGFKVDIGMAMLHFRVLGCCVSLHICHHEGREEKQDKNKGKKIETLLKAKNLLHLIASQQRTNCMCHVVAMTNIYHIQAFNDKDN